MAEAKLAHQIDPLSVPITSVYGAILYETGSFYARSGKGADALRILKQIESRANESEPALVAAVYAALEDRDRAFEWLEKAYQEHTPFISLLRSSFFESLRGDPRYTDLERRIGLPE